MPGLDDPDRAAVRVPARDRRRRVDHRAAPCGDQALGGDAVDVGVVDHRDVARLHPARRGPWCAGPPAPDPVTASAAPCAPGASGGPSARLRLLGRFALRASCPLRAPLAVASLKSSSACRRAWAESSTPASIRESSATRSSPSDRLARWPCVRPPCSAFRTTTWASAHAATCARWVTHSTWALSRERGQLPADRGAGLTADPGVDLVEHEHRTPAPATPFGERDPQREHRPGELAARTRPWPAAAPARPGSRRAGRSPDRRRPRPARPASTSTARSAPGHREAPEPLLHRLGQRTRGRRARRRAAARGLGRRPTRPAPGRASSSATRASWPSSSARRAAASSRYAITSARVVAVLALAGRGAAAGAAGPRRAARGPRRRTPPRPAARARPRRARPGARAPARSSSRERRPRRAARRRRPRPRRPRAPSTDVVRGHAAPRGPRPRRRALLLRARGARPRPGRRARRRRSRRPGTRAATISRARVRASPPSPCIAASIARGARRAPPGTRRSGFERRRAGERVEHRALHRRREQALVRVLAVQVDQRAPRSASSATVASRPST